MATRPLSVGVVAHEAEGEATGCGRLLIGLLQSLPPRCRSWRWLLFLRGQRPPDALQTQGWFEPVRVNGWRSPTLWEQIGVAAELRRREIDVLFSPAPSLPRAGVPSVCCVHDLSFDERPRDFRLRERWRRRLTTRQAARRARFVVTERASVAREIAARYRLEPQRVATIRPGIDRDQWTPEIAPRDAERLRSLGVQAPFLLSAGALLDRRPLRPLLESHRALLGDHPDLGLVVAGANRLRDRTAPARWRRELGLGESVRFLGHVADAELAALYRHASLTYYLSDREGFGFPPFESLACGTPAVVSRDQALIDEWPDYPLVADPVAESISAVTVRGLRAEGSRLAAKAAPVLERHSWYQASSEWARLLERAAGGASQ